jgi:hypothetical protein
MANVLSLALKISADASGLRLDPVQRALVNLGNEADKLTGQFEKFAGGSEAAAAAQEDFARRSQELVNNLRDTGGATQFAAAFEKLSEEARELASAFEEGAKIQQKYGDSLKNNEKELARLTKLYDLGAIDLIAYNKASSELLGLDKQAAESAKARADAQAQAARQTAALESEAARIRQSNLTAQEQFDAAIGRASDLRRQGLLTEQDFNRELERQSQIFARNSIAANQLGDSIEKAGEQTLKFNELSGILAVLPGPLGNIAGRISGIASASQGLARVFAGGLQAGVTSVVSSFAALANPVTLAVAGIAAFGAAASAVVNGLTALEDRVEKLGNTAAKLGVSFQFIQNLEESARRSGTSIDAVSAAFGRLQKSVLGVDEESKAAQKALSDIGVTAEELSALSPEQQYDRIGKAIAGIEDPAKRTAAATALFGRAGADLIPFFNNIGKATADMERFGATLSDVDRGRIDSLGDAFDGVFVALRALGQSVLLPFAGLVEGIVKAFSGLINIVTAVAQIIGAVLGPVLDGVGKALGFFGDVINSTVGFFRGLFGGADEAAEATAKVTENLARTAKETEALNKAFESSQKGLDSAIAKAGEFGQAGFDAAFQFEQALADLQEQADEGELNAEQYARGVANATAEFEKQIDVARQVAEENKRIADEAAKRAQAEADAVQKIIDSNLEQQRIERDFGGDSGRFRAAENLLKINEEIARVQKEIEAARAAGDQAAVDALTSRLSTLDQVAAREDDIASGAKKQREEAAKAAEAAAKEAEKLAEQRRKAEERINKQIAETQQKFQERQFEIEKERAEELGNIRSGSIKINDLRSGGISAFFDALKEDPAVAEAKKQTKELEQIRKGIAKLEAEKVDILAGTG